MSNPAIFERVFFEGGGFRVTDRLLITPRKTYALGRVEYVSVTRPLLLFAGGPALGVLGFAGAFWRYLSLTEFAVLGAGALLTIAAASLVGSLRVHSLALRDEEVAQSFGLVSQLRDVRRAVEKAMVFRAGGEVVR